MVATWLSQLADVNHSCQVIYVITMSNLMCVALLAGSLVFGVTRQAIPTSSRLFMEANLLPHDWL